MHRRLLWFAVLILSALVVAPGSAQGPKTDPPSPRPVDHPTAGSAPLPRVTEVRVERGHHQELPKGSPVQLDDHLVIIVSNYRQALTEDSDCFDLRLFLDGQAIKAPGPERCVDETGEVWFNIARIHRGKEPAWQDLIAKRDGLHAEAAVSVGLKDQTRPLDTVAQGRRTLQFKLLHEGRVIAAAALYLAVLTLFLWLAGRSGILRVGGAAVLPERRRPYSLARVQMAWWFFLVLGAFLFITMISGNAAPIPTAVLGLIGIASGTYLGAEVIDSGKREEEEEDELKSDDGSSTTTTTTTTVARRRRKGLYGFFADILSDASGISFPRFQIVALTMILGAIFVVRVTQRLAMPEFDTTLLGLMGISSGTYIGAKLPEPTK